MIKLNHDTLTIYCFGAVLMAVSLFWLGVFDYKEVRRYRGIVKTCQSRCDKPMHATIVNFDGTQENSYSFECICGGNINYQGKK